MDAGGLRASRSEVEKFVKEHKYLRFLETSAKSGLGYMIWNAWEILSVERMYVGLLTIAVLGFLFTLALNELERFIIPWKAE